MTRATARRWAWAAYLAGAAVLAALYSLVPPFASSGPVFNLLGLSPVVAILVGVRLQRPSSVAPWYLFAAGFALFWLGDLYTYSYPKLFNREVPFPSIGDGFYIAVYPVLMLGLLALVRKRSARSGDRSLIDATILTVGLALPSWLALIAPYLHDGSLTVVAKLVSVAYPLGDVLLLAAAIRLALDGGRRGPAFGLMSMSIVALLITDFVYGVMILNGTYDHQLSLDLGWVAFYVLFGAAALHPSMTSLEHAERRTRSPLTPVRLALLACASIIAPALELAHDVDRHDLDQSVVTGAALVLFGLVVVRMAGLMRTQERTQARERALSEEIARRQGEERLASLVRHSSDLITVVGADGLVTYQSPASERILGWTPEEVVGRSIHELIDPAEAGRLLHLIADGARGDGSQAIECALYHQDGTTRQFEVLLTSLLDDEHVRGIVLNSRDISERKAFERQLAHQAFHDPVTGLPNRALFVERVRHAIARGRREGRGLGVVFIDLDDFKIINDSLGHAAGDEVLQQVAQRLDQAVRASDTAARFGGDEFAVLLEDVDGVQEAADTAERIMDALGLPLTAGHNELSLRCSIGIAMAADGEPVDADELIRDADAAMYIAKRDGKGGYRVFEPEMHEGVLARLELRTDLQRALVEDQLELYFQPVVRLEDGSVSGVEALLRWNHPERGLVSPVQFIPLAEETGLIVPIGRWVLREGCRQGRELLRELPQERRVSISINLSLKQLQHSDIVADVRDALEESGLDPSSLTLEITESVLMADTDLAVTRLAELKELGIRLALDDFGTGYSSLSYLSKFPVDVLKMDRSFLQDGASPQQADLATAVVALGSTLSLEVVAEGIEMPEQWHTLRDLGCDLGQGFYFARPMNVAATREFLSGAPDQAPAADAP